MLWDKKAHKEGNPERLMVKPWFSRGMVKKVRSAKSGIKVEPGTIYVIKTKDEAATLIKGSEPYIDTVMMVNAIGVSVRNKQHELIPLYDRTFAESLRFVDLLFIWQIAFAGEEDIRYLRGLIYERAMRDNPTGVDDLTAIESAAAFFDQIQYTSDQGGC